MTAAPYGLAYRDPRTDQPTYAWFAIPDDRAEALQNLRADWPGIETEFLERRSS